MSELCRLRRSEGCGACANEFGMRGGELHILRLIAVIALFGHGVNAGNQALHSDGAILLGGNGLLHSVPPDGEADNGHHAVLRSLFQCYRTGGRSRAENGGHD